MNKEIKLIVRAAFIFLGVIVFANVMFLSGMLMGKYGGNPVFSLAVSVSAIAIFHCGIFLGRYKKYNPL